MTNAAKEVRYFLNNRPLCFLSTVFSIRDFILGLALFLGVHDLSQSRLVANLNELGGAWIYGIVFMVIAATTATSAIANNTSITKLGLQAQAWWWLFACVTYLVNGNIWNGNIWLALIFGVLASVPSGYLAFYYKHNDPLWELPRQQWREKYGLEPLKK
jgi:hypothetical protein